MKTVIKLFVFALMSAIVASFTGSTIVGAAVGLAIVSMLIPKSKSGFAYMAIAPQDARNVFTKTMIKVYLEKVSVPGFLRSFFPVIETMSKLISIEVQRNSEKVAVDVERGTAGNRNKMSLSTEKIFKPPFYWEYFDANELELYDIAIGQQDPSTIANLGRAMAEKLFKIRQKIERAYELQCAQVLETGIVQLEAGVNINFKRKADSLVDLTATPWTTGTNDPYTDLETGATFIRTEGKSNGTVFNLIFGSEVLSAFLNNDIVKERADIRNFKLDNINKPQKNSTGGTLHGEISFGAYTGRIWTYPEFHDNDAGVSVAYVNPKKVIMLPENPNFNLVFAAVPQLMVKGRVKQQGAFMVQEFLDERLATHEVNLKSAGVALPIAVDTIWTGQPVA